MKMKEIKIVFWNVGNLFETDTDELLNDEFNTNLGYNKNVKKEKIKQLADGIKNLKFKQNGNINHNIDDNNEPDLIGFCEVENQDVLMELTDAINPRKYNVAEYKNSPDVRGIDTCLVYSKEIFECIETKGYSVDLRYPTRDIFYAHLNVKENNSDLHVLVNHWPSRRGRYESCSPNDTAYARNLSAERCGMIVDGILKVDRNRLLQLPNIQFPNPDKSNENQNYLEELEKSNTISNFLDELEHAWNKNILIMGDFNDDPFNESITDYLGAVPDIHRCRQLKEIFELRIKDERRWIDTNYKRYYLEEKPYLFNCMWKFFTNQNYGGQHDKDSRFDSNSSYDNFDSSGDIPRGTLYYWRDNSWNIFDQFIISRGLFYGIQELKMDTESVDIIFKGFRLKDNIPAEKFDNKEDRAIFHKDRKRIHPAMRSTPFSFSYIKNRYYYHKDKEAWSYDQEKNDRPEQEPNRGYSDHFPITCKIKIM